MVVVVQSREMGNGVSVKLVECFLPCGDSFIFSDSGYAFKKCFGFHMQLKSLKVKIAASIGCKNKNILK